MKQIANGQTSDREISCIVYERPANYIEFAFLFRSEIDFQIARHLPHIFSQLISAIALLNKHGIACNHLIRDNILVASVRKGWEPAIMLTGFSRSTITRNSPASADKNLYRKDLTITTALINKAMFDTNKHKFDYTKDDTIDPAEKEQFQHDYESLENIVALMKGASKWATLAHFQLLVDEHMLLSTP
ncbi:hypothetical protein SYNPS1DRAFT_30896 [Syncephalis pseudoplumigaleata]|nr:hypothetical protein SYNPS1DRAFT_30896 [Syncephalis pseudoplumigaleata]|eukprot:RKP23365.1 hypothetical protein SYNPS1DRAFT_30896 [Syncephalis pseudoplumigaleata]